MASIGDERLTRPLDGSWRLSSSSMSRSNRPKAVVTGLGAVSALGVGIEDHWDRLVAGESGISKVEGFDSSGFQSPFGGEVKDFDVRKLVPKSYRKSTKVMARDTELAVAAAAGAAGDAALVTRSTDGSDMTIASERLGCLIGAGLISADTVELATALRSSLRETPEAVDLEFWGEEGMKGLPPLWMLKYLPNMPACHVTIVHGARGPSNTVVCGEASGLLSVGEAVRVLERGAADACFAGGTESKLNPMGLARFQAWGRLGKVDPNEPDPWQTLKPFDPTSPGSQLGEASGVLIVESAESASSRGARVYARVLGQGSSQSSSAVRGVGSQIGLTGAPGEGASRGLVDAAERAIADAGLTPDEIDAVFPQATGVPAMDGPEGLALAAVFGDRLGEIPAIPISPYVGDTMAAAGAMQAIVAAKSLEAQQIPARLHAGTPAGSVCAAASPSESRELRAVLVCSASLAGQCAAVVLGRA